MGGNVALTIRTNTAEWRMDRWTNIMPAILHDINFLKGDPKSLNEIIKPWEDMANDWKKNQPDGPFDFNMIPVYAPFPYGLKPSEYGAIVIDFTTNTLLSLQHYCDVGTVGWGRLEFGPSASSVQPDRDEQINDLFSHNAIKYFTMILRKDIDLTPLLALGATKVTDPQTGMPAIKIPAPKSLDILTDVTDAINANHSNRSPFFLARAVVDMSPFQVIQFQETPAGYQAMYTKLQNLGFSFTEDEKQGWKARMKAE